MTDDGKDLGPFDRKAMLAKLPSDAKVIDRANVEQVARICGPSSHAAQALARADAHGGPVRFWHSAELGMLWLELPEDKRH